MYCRSTEAISNYCAEDKKRAHSWDLAKYTVQESHLSHMYRSAVAVIQSDPMEDLGCLHSIFPHVLPEEWAVLWFVAIPQLDTVTPWNQLSSQVNITAYQHNGGGWGISRLFQIKYIQLDYMLWNLVTLTCLCKVPQGVIPNHPAIMCHAVGGLCCLHVLDVLLQTLLLTWQGEVAGEREKRARQSNPQTLTTHSGINFHWEVHLNSVASFQISLFTQTHTHMHTRMHIHTHLKFMYTTAYLYMIGSFSVTCLKFGPLESRKRQRALATTLVTAACRWLWTSLYFSPLRCSSAWRRPLQAFPRRSSCCKLVSLHEGRWDKVKDIYHNSYSTTDSTCR